MKARPRWGLARCVVRSGVRVAVFVVWAFRWRVVLLVSLCSWGAGLRPACVPLLCCGVACGCVGVACWRARDLVFMCRDLFVCLVFVLCGLRPHVLWLFCVGWCAVLSWCGFLEFLSSFFGGLFIVFFVLVDSPIMVDSSSIVDSPMFSASRASIFFPLRSLCGADPYNHVAYATSGAPSRRARAAHT